MKNNYYGWSHGYTDLLLSLEDQTPKLFDVEFDHYELHEMCGGRTIYTSRSGDSGELILNQLGSLIPVGIWRVDTRYNSHQSFVFVGTTLDEYEREVFVVTPYVSHEEDKQETLEDNPVVIKVGG